MCSYSRYVRPSLYTALLSARGATQPTVVSAMVWLLYRISTAGWRVCPGTDILVYRYGGITTGMVLQRVGSVQLGEIVLFPEHTVASLWTSLLLSGGVGFD